MFRPEMLRPMGLPEDVNVIAWGLSLVRLVAQNRELYLVMLFGLLALLVLACTSQRLPGGDGCGSDCLGCDFAVCFDGPGSRLQPARPHYCRSGPP
jgi:hypothetical protein